MVALALTGICMSQVSEEEKKFYEDYEKSELRTIAAYPDAAKPDSPLSIKMMEIEKALKLAGDPLYNSAEKPFILAERAAKELGIGTFVRVPQTPSDDKSQFVRPGFKAVTVRRIEPDGLSIINDVGVAKIPIEELTPEERSKYGITTEGAAEYRKQVAANTATYYANQKASAIQAQADAEAAAVAAQAAAEQEAQDRANRPIAQAPVWKRFVKNEAFRKNNRAGIADEIRRQDGDAAADRFLTEERLNELEDAQKGGEVVVPTVIPTREVALEGGKYFRQGDRITINGDQSGGYRIEGDKMYSFSSGTPTHTRSGSMWIPLDSSQPQIRDSER